MDSGFCGNAEERTLFVVHAEDANTQWRPLLKTQSQIHLLSDPFTESRE